LEDGISHISGIVEHFPYIGLFLLLVLGGIGLPLPEDTTLILCGFLISTEVIEPVPALLVVYAGLIITDFGLFSVGKKYGRKIVNHRRFHKIISPKRLSILENKFRRNGILFILVGRHFAGLRAQIFLTAGVIRMPDAEFLIADGISSVLTIAIMVGAGYAGGHSLQVIKRDITRIEHVGIFLAVILLAVYLIFRYVRSRRNERGRP
jgi:membrane protein DedA with SNARE-associated domain